MKYRVFQFAIPCGEEVEELNQFLSTHRVTSVRHHLVRSDQSPTLVFVIEYVDASDAKPAKSKIDYREVLTEAQFGVFSRLRDLRKKIADEEGVPVYTVFTNAQLAEMVQRNVKSQESLVQIPGLGRTRIEKYGAEVIAVIADVSEPQSRDEKS